MKRRVLCTLLALLLVISILPGYAAAAGTGAEKEVRTSEDSEVERVGYASENDNRFLNRIGDTPIEYSVSSDDLDVRDAICSRIINALSNWETSVNVRDYEASIDFCNSCYYGVINEHPEFFYAGGNTEEEPDFTCSYIPSTGIVTSLTLYYKERYSESDIVVFNNVCSQIMGGMPNGTDEEKLLYFHDYLITHCHYDMDFYENESSNQRDAYCALVDGCAVCQGYMLAFKHLCNLARLDAECVISDGLDHGWNIVQVDNAVGTGASYYIDCTWDDPTNRPECTCKHMNFLREKNKFLTDEECKHVDSKTGIDYEDWKNGYGEIIYFTRTTNDYYEYVNGWWKGLIRPVQWVGNLMCYAKSSDASHVYFRNSGSSSETSLEIPSSNVTWWVVGSTNSYWPGSYITVASLAEDFYFSTTKEIWKLTVDGEMSLVYTLTDAEQAQGYIYGILADGGDLVYYIGVDPNSPSVAYGTLHIGSQGSGVTITSQPADVTVAAGQTATFSVTADGATGYQWYVSKDGGETWTKVLNNSTSATYSLTTAAKHNGYQYYCQVSNAGVSVDSEVATLTVSSGKPTITSQPSNVTVAAGSTATFKVTATGATGYQWYVSKDNGVTWTKILNNSTSATYSLTTAAKHNGYRYYCEVSNAAGSVNSNTVTLTVSSKPTITSQPSNVTVAAGSTATFKVTATGATSYQWQYRKSSTASWTAVSAASGKTANYSLTAETRHNGYQYRCTVINAAGSVYSDTVTLTVSSGKPTITTQPSNVSVTVGSTATFKVTATGATSYQWYYRTSSSGSWTAVSATSGKTSTYKLTTAAKHNGYQYRCKVTNSSGSVYSGTVTLTVKPKITEQPTNQTVAAGTTAHFKVTAENATSYQWYYRTSSTGTWTAVSAASGKTADYSLSAAARHNGYQYRCKVMNATSYVYTSIVTLTVAVK